MKNKIISKIVSFFFLFVLMGTLSAYAQKSKARAQFISLKRGNVSFKGDKNGFDFEKVKFKYQFITCKNTLMLGIAYDKNAVFTKYWKNGKSYNKVDVKTKQWAKPEDIRIHEVRADLFFGRTKLGSVKLSDIPERYSGCSGKVYEIMKMVGFKGSSRAYISNINRLSIRNIRVLKASAKNNL